MSLLVPGQNYENVWFKMGEETVLESVKQKLLGIEIESEF